MVVTYIGAAFKTIERTQRKHISLSISVCGAGTSHEEKKKKREAVAKYENKLNKTLRKIPLTADVPSAAFINDTQASKSPALLSHNNRTLVLKKSVREANSHGQRIVQIQFQYQLPAHE